jgi:DNA-binding response OmpR family regulator
MEKNQKILIIEDDVEICGLIKMILERNGYLADTEYSAKGVIQKLIFREADLIILDWMLPEVSGVEFLNSLRQNNQMIPVLMLTAKALDENIIEGLEQGADDYLTKPFEPSIFLARVRALLRRKYSKSDIELSEHIINENLKINTQTYEVMCENKSLDLTKSEFKILAELAKNRGKIFTRSQLINHVQGEEVNVTGRTIDTHIFGLRKKLSNHANVIETIRGIGYRVN